MSIAVGCDRSHVQLIPFLLDMFARCTHCGGCKTCCIQWLQLHLGFTGESAWRSGRKAGIVGIGTWLLCSGQRARGMSLMFGFL